MTQAALSFELQMNIVILPECSPENPAPLSSKGLQRGEGGGVGDGDADSVAKCW